MFLKYKRHANNHHLNKRAKQSKAGIALQKMLEILKTQPGVQIVEEERSPYNPEFVKKK
jgi:hypothetical protein